MSTYTHYPGTEISVAHSLSLIQSCKNFDINKLLSMCLTRTGCMGDAFAVRNYNTQSVPIGTPHYTIEGPLHADIGSPSTISFRLGTIIFPSGKIFMGGNYWGSVEVPRLNNTQQVVVAYQPLRQSEGIYAERYFTPSDKYYYRRSGVKVFVREKPNIPSATVDEFVVAELEYGFDDDYPVVTDLRARANLLRSSSLLCYSALLEPDIYYSNDTFVWLPYGLITKRVMDRERWSTSKIETDVNLDNEENRYVFDVQYADPSNEIVHHKSILLPITDASQNITSCLPCGLSMQNTLFLRDRNNSLIVPYSVTQASQIIGGSDSDWIQEVELDVWHEYSVLKVRPIMDYGSAPWPSNVNLPEGFVQMWFGEGDSNAAVHNIHLPYVERSLPAFTADEDELYVSNYVINPLADRIHVRARAVYPNSRLSIMATRDFRKKHAPVCMNMFGLDFRDYAPTTATADGWSSYDSGGSADENGQTFFMANSVIDSTTSMVTVVPADPSKTLVMAELVNYYQSNAGETAKLVCQEIDDFEIDIENPAVGAADPYHGDWSGPVSLNATGGLLHFYVVQDSPSTSIEFRGTLMLYMSKD